MDLLVDLGNTRAKWATHDAGGVRLGAAVAMAQVDWSQTLDRQWSALPAPRAVIVAAVASAEHARAIVRMARARFPDTECLALDTPAHACGVRNGYDDPVRLGVDRMLAMIGARARHAGPCVVAAAGTALAVDVLDAHGQHRGGAILPSAASMIQAVLRSTARVHATHEGTVPAEGWGRSTEDGLATGAWLAQAALIDRIASDACAQLGSVPRVFVHGGAASGLMPLLRCAAEAAPELVFEGMVLRVAERRAVKPNGGS
jgi:type III pantothenate kinase